MYKKILAAALILLLAAAAGTLLLWHWQSGSQAQAEPSDSEEESEDGEEAEDGDVYYNGVWYVENSKLETILLIGIDKFEDDLDQHGYINSQQADFLLLLIFDRESGDCTALQLNRDIMTEITVLGVTGAQAGTVTAQLALAHTYGSGGSDSCVNTVKAVSNLLYGVDVDHYAAVTMDTVPIINDLAGGVTLTVMDDLTLYDEALVEGEEITLTGDQALTYVRARFYIADGTNLHRMERQQQYMLALWKQVSQCAAEDGGFLTKLYLEISSYLTTDCSTSKLTELFDAVAGLEPSEILTIEGENVLGEVYMEYYVDEDALQELVLQLFYQQVGE